MADDEYTLQLVVRAIDEFSKTFATLNTSLTSVQKAQAAAAVANKKEQSGLSMLKGTYTEFNSMLGVARQAYTMVAGAINKVIGETVQYSETVRDMVRVTGMAAEEASRLVQVADDAFISIGSVEAAMKMAVRKGFNPTIDAVMALADEYNALTDPMAKNKLLLEHFGRAGLEMGKMLEMGSEGIRASAAASDALGLTLTGKNVDAIKDYKVQMDNLNDVVEGFKTQLALKLIPVLATAAKALDLLVFGTERLNTALAEHGAEVASTTTSYGAYRAEMDRVAETSNRVGVSQAEYNRQVEYGVENARTGHQAMVVLTEDEYNHQAALRASSGAMDTAAYAAVGHAKNLSMMTEAEKEAARAANTAGDAAQDLSVDEYLAKAAALALSGDVAGARYFYTLATAAGASADAIARVITNYKLMMSIGSGWSGMPGVGGVSVGGGGGSATTNPNLMTLAPWASAADKAYAAAHPESYNKALGGPLSPWGTYSVGERGEEGIVNGVVIEHNEWMKWKRAGIGLDNQFYIPEGAGPVAGAPPVLAPKSPNLTSKDISASSGFAGSVFSGGGGAAASPVAQAAVQMAAMQAAAEVVAQVVAAVPSSAALTQAVLAPVMAAQAQASADAKTNQAQLDQIISILRRQGTADDSGRSMKEAAQLLGG